MQVPPISWKFMLWAAAALSLAACERNGAGEDEADSTSAATSEAGHPDATFDHPDADAAGPTASQGSWDSSTESDATLAPVDATSGAPDIGNDAGPPGAVVCPTDAEEKFSFFLISHRALQRESGKPDGFGGNFGGLMGADAICQRVAEHSSPCQKSKVWRAFLSTSKVDAIDRIGMGPWYDRVGRLVAKTKEDLLYDRPRGADPVIVNDFPNEDGVPNHDPDGTGLVDNHQILTGSGRDGRLYKQSTATDAGVRGSSTACNGEAWSVEKATCWDWTSAEPQGCPRVGHSWPRQGSGINWISVWNEGGCAPGGTLAERGGLDGTRRVGSAGGYGGFYCFAVRP